MKPTILVLTTALVVASGALTLPGSPAADPPKGPALDTSFLKLYSETRGFILGRPQKPKITPDGKAVLFLRAEPKTPKLKLYEFDVASGQTKELLSPEMLLKGADENLTPEEKARRERQRVTVGGFADYFLDPDGTRVLVKLSNKLYVFDRTTGKATELKTGEGGAIVDPKWSPDGKLIAYVRGFDVYAYDLAAGKETAVTTGGTEVKTHGLAEFVAQEEMHRHSGFWWSPDSKSIAYEEADHTGVEQWFVADPFKPGAAPSPQYYPRPGGKNVAVRLGIIPVAGGNTVWVDPMKPIAKAGGRSFEYLAAVRWDRHGPLTLVLQDRLQRSPVYLDVDPQTGVAAAFHMTLEKDAWVPLRPDEPRWLADGRYLLGYQGDAADGVLVIQPRKTTRVVVSPADGHTGIEMLGAADGHLLYTAHTDSPERHLFRVAIKNVPDRGPGDAPARLTRDAGVHTAAVSADCRLAVVTSTTTGRMPRADIVAREGSHLGTLPSVALDPPFKPNVTVEKVGDFWTGVVRPKDFDPKKKYPVVVFVYGGPTSLVVTQAMQPWLLRQWLADQGFVVVVIDNRGTPGRGRNWEKAVYQKFGTVPLDDQVKGLSALCDKFPELDRERVGLIGWSFGGYMAANGVLRRPDVFKAAVAGAPVTDWADYDTHYTERYMGLLPESQAAYDEASLIPLAKGLSRPLLLVSGTADDNVYFRHTLKLTDALFRAGRDFEVLPLPGITHLYTSDPTVTERLWAKSATFFKKHLGEPK
jgi:dipeptidyl-peptidase-4